MLNINSINEGVLGDAPGMRYTIYLQGCNLRCWYCHNPECQSTQPGSLRKIDSIIDDIIPMIPYLKASGGGVTLSGGEPLLQAKELIPLCLKLKELSLHIALDTAGHKLTPTNRRLLDSIDLVLLDVKSVNEQVFKDLTGAKLRPTILFANHLSRIKKPVFLRYVLVPRITDNVDDIRALALWAKRLGNIKRVDVLPFHQLAATKYRLMRKPYKLEGHSPATKDLVNKAKSIFKAHQLKVN